VKYVLDFGLDPVDFESPWFSNGTTNLKFIRTFEAMMIGVCFAQIWHSSVYSTP